MFWSHWSNETKEGTVLSLILAAVVGYGMVCTAYPSVWEWTLFLIFLACVVIIGGVCTFAIGGVLVLGMIDLCRGPQPMKLEAPIEVINRRRLAAGQPAISAEQAWREMGCPTASEFVLGSPLASVMRDRAAEGERQYRASTAWARQ